MRQAPHGQRPVTFTVPGVIGGKGRGRATIRGGHAVVYTPSKTRATEAMVREIAAGAMDGRTPMAGPLSLQIYLWAVPPKSWSKKRQASTVWVTGKPDCDNILKLCADSMNGIIYGDDSQIANVSFTRCYGQLAQVIIKVSPLVAAELAA